MNQKSTSRFAGVTEWVFDLDNTLYPRECDLFSQIDRQMTDFVSRLTGLDHVNARKLQKELYFEYGTTLRGLMTTHDIDPYDFLNHAHDIDYSRLPSSPGLGNLLEKLPGRKIIYTNGSVSHAENTLAAMEIGHVFDEIFDIIASDFIPKPMSDPFNKFLELHDIDPSKAAMFEDLPRNLEPAKSAGMVTVLVKPGKNSDYHFEHWEKTGQDSEHIDIETDDLNALIRDIVE